MNILLGLSNIFCGLIIIGVSIPLAKEHIPMNKWYGIRFKKSYESDDNWYKMNKYGGTRLIIWSIPIVLIGIATFFIPSESLNTSLIIFLALFPLIVIIPSFESYLYSRKI